MQLRLGPWGAGGGGAPSCSLAPDSNAYRSVMPFFIAGFTDTAVPPWFHSTGYILSLT